MERYSFKNIEKKWRNNKALLSVANSKSEKNITVWKCFLTHLGKFTWVM